MATVIGLLGSLPVLPAGVEKVVLFGRTLDQARRQAMVNEESRGESSAVHKR